ncbi:MAG: HAD family phosphatase [bacterium]
MNHIKNKIKAIIFDMDGTVVDSEHVWRKAIIDVVKAEGVELNQQNLSLIKNSFSANLREVTEKIKKEFKIKSTVEELMQKKEFLALEYFKHINDLKFIKGFENFHKILQINSIPTSIATNSDIGVLTQISTKMNLERFFGPHIYSADHVNAKRKPDPSLFLFAAEKLLVRPDECIIFEDSGAGFEAAKSAGIKCIGINNEAFKKDLKLADYIINDYDEAIDAIKKII